MYLLVNQYQGQDLDYTTDTRGTIVPHTELYQDIRIRHSAGGWRAQFGVQYAIGPRLVSAHLTATVLT